MPHLSINCFLVLVTIVGTTWGSPRTAPPAPARHPLLAQRRPLNLQLTDTTIHEITGGHLVQGQELLNTRANDERSQSLALFARGRLQFQRERYAESLQSYERAFQWNPSANIILDEIVPLTFHLKRSFEGTRYAVLAAERDPTQYDLVQPVVFYLMDENEFARAFDLLRRSHQANPVDKDDRDYLRRHMELGRLGFLAEQYELAADSLAIIDDALENPRRFNLSDADRRRLLQDARVTYTLLGEAFLQARRLDRAERAFEKAHEAEPNQALLAFHRAEVSMARKNSEQTARYLREYWDANSTDAGMDPFDLLRQLLEAENKLNDETEGLVARLETHIKDHAEDIAAVYALAEFLNERKEFPAAVSRYRAALEKTPTLEGFEHAIGAARKAGDAAAVIEFLNGLVQSVGSLNAIPAELDDLIKDKELTAKIRELFERQVAAEKATSDQAYAIGLLAIATGDLEASEKLFAYARQKSDEVPVEWPLNIGLDYFLLDHNKLAIKWFREALKPLPTDRQTGVRIYLATALAMDKQIESARNVLQEADKTVAESPLALNRLAWITYYSEQYSQAREEYEALIRRLDSNREDIEIRTLLKEARSILSNICLELGDEPAAVEWLQQILDEFPQDIGAMNDLGYLWADANQHLNLAYEMIRQAVEAEPDNIAYQDSLGWVLCRLGRYTEALTPLEKACQSEKVDGIILDHLGDVYVQLSRAADAISVWERAIQAFRDDEEEDKIEAVRAKVERTREAIQENNAE